MRRSAASQTRSLVGPSTRSTRTASIGLAGVVICLALFSIVSAYETQKWVDRVQSNASLLGAYLGSTAAILAAESSEVEFRLDPSQARRDELTEANDDIDQALKEVAARGDLEEVELVNSILVLHARYRDTSIRLFAAMDAGDLVLARSIDIEEGDPLVEAMRESITNATSKHAAETESTLATLRSIAQLMLIIAPVVFAVGSGLLFALWRVLERYNRKERESYREIEALSMVRAEFVSTVSHEFRTPLTGIQGFSELLRDEELTSAEVHEYAADINKEARRLARLISDLLDLDRLESGRIVPTTVPLNLNRVVAEAAARLRLSASSHPIELDLDDDLPDIGGDADRFMQVVTNLLSNAIKYSPAGGAVHIRTTREVTSVLLTIRDHGIGIPEDQLERIFERYTRIESSATQGVHGTGLGLPIVRQIVQLYEGKVWATSEQGQGSTFHVQLPLLDSAVVGGTAARARPRAA